MTPFRAFVHDRRIEIPAPDEFPDGAEVWVEVVGVSEKIGLEESEWSDDPAAIADWKDWLQTIEPIDFSEPDAFNEEFLRFNVEAVRRKMSE